MRTGLATQTVAHLAAVIPTDEHHLPAVVHGNELRTHGAAESAVGCIVHTGNRGLVTTLARHVDDSVINFSVPRSILASSVVSIFGMAVLIT